MNSLSEKLLRNWGPRLSRGIARVVGTIPFSLEVDVVRDGVRYRLDLHEHAQRIMYLNLYERRLRRQMMKLLLPGHCVVDIGANVGFWALQCAQVLGPSGYVYAIEPNPWAIQRLRRNILLNRRLQPLSPIEIVSSAVGDQEGWVELLANNLANQASQASLYPPERGQDCAALQKITVPITRLEHVVKRHINLLKIDVEGHEMAVLQGAENLFRQSPADYVVIEAHSGNLARAGQTREGLLAQLRRLGYAPLDTGLDLFGTMAWKYAGRCA